MRATTRNIGILAHVDAGKTTITERILFRTGATYKQGDVHSGTTVTDFDPQERARGITIFAAAVSCDWAGHRINLIDTPGHIDFADEVERSLRVLDGAVVALDAVAGVQTQSEAVWRQADRYAVPRIAFVNQLDRPGADLDRAVASIRDRLGVTPLVVQCPIGQEAGFIGVVDLLDERTLVWQDGALSDGVVPSELASDVERRRQELVEAVAERHPVALEEFGRDGTLSGATLRRALRDLTLEGAAVVVLAGAAYRDRGIEPLLDAVVSYLPSPVDRPPVRGVWAGTELTRGPGPDEPFAGLVFKVGAMPTGRLTYLRVYAGSVHKGQTVLDAGTGRRERIGRILPVQADRHTDVDTAEAGDIVALVGPRAAAAGATLCAPAAPLVLEPPVTAEPLVSVAVEAGTAGGADRLTAALQRLVEEDPSLRLRTDPETGQTLLSGLGELHLEVAVEKVRQQHELAVRTGRPRVTYRERLVCGVRGFGYRHIRQEGGNGQYAVIVLDLEPSTEDDFGFESTVIGGRVPAVYVRAVEAGCRDALADGPLGGHPVVGLRVRLTDGATHPQDSSELAFRTAGRLGLRAALREAGLVLLEPVVELTAVVPADDVGGVLGDLLARRGRVEGTANGTAGNGNGNGAMVTVAGIVPLAELFGYATALRGRTHGRGTFSTRPAGYAPTAR